MKRNDILIVLTLLLAIFAYPVIDRHIVVPLFGIKPSPAKAPPAAPEPADAQKPPAQPGTPANTQPAPAQPEITPPATNAATRVEAPEALFSLRNKLVEIRLSNRGAGVVSATFTNYTAAIKSDSGPLTWDFREETSGVYQGLPGVSAENSLQATRGENDRTLVFTGETAGGLQFTRTCTLAEDNYNLTIRDTFKNPAATQISLPAHSLRLGRVRQLDKVTEFFPTLGVDVAHLQGEGVNHYSKKVNEWAGDAGKGKWDSQRIGIPAEWVALKNKFFVKLLYVHEGEGEQIDSTTVRLLSNAEGKGAEKVAADLQLAAVPLEPGSVFTRDITLYVGPKKLDKMQALGKTMHEAMDFGMWRIFAGIPRVLLRLLNFFHDHVPPYNYGIAIILLTLLVRGLFWPLMNANSEQMRKMQALAPEIAAVRAKYKNDFQRQNREIMEVYKKHGVNPMAPLRGCLPLLLQLPVFFALFGVLRAAVELRYASFLWIRDLSEPENLFAGLLPFQFNILPLAMTFTMYFQQKLTPSTMDEMQKKIMSFFPFIFLIFFYTMPSGLLLYWTTSNLISIYQLVHKSRKDKARTAAEAEAKGAHPHGHAHSPDSPPPPGAPHPGAIKHKGKKRR